MFKKTIGKTVDNRGCEFHYKRLYSKSFNAAKCEFETTTIYVCIEFPIISALTLKKLKEKMTNL